MFQNLLGFESFFLQFCHLFLCSLKKARFGHVSINGVGSVSHILLLRYVLCRQTVINVTGHIQSNNPSRVCSSIYLDKEWFLSRLHLRLCDLQCTE